MIVFLLRPQSNMSLQPGIWQEVKEIPKQIYCQSWPTGTTPMKIIKTQKSSLNCHPTVKILANALTHCGLVRPYGDIELVNNGSGNGLLPDGTKPLPKPMLTCQWNTITTTWLKGKFIRDTPAITYWYLFENYFSKIPLKFLRGQCIKGYHSLVS